MNLYTMRELTMTLVPKMLKILTLVLTLSAAPSRAEILHNIYPYENLKSIKTKYPNGRFKKVDAAWVTADQAFYQMTGEGFPGTLFINFSDKRPEYRTQLAECGQTTPDAPSENICSLLRKWSYEPDDESLTVVWVRWMPSAVIPLERYKSKYGEPKITFSDDTMIPKASWDSRGLTARLTDDKKNVVFIETNFTRSELRDAWKKTAGFIPEYLKDPASKPRSETKK